MLPRNVACSLVIAISCSYALAGEVVEITESNWRRVAPNGKEADWIFGDYVLRNDKITAVIAKPIETRNANMTVRNVAGAVIDLTFRYRPNDQLSCFYPGAAEYPLRSLTHRTENDETIVVCTGETAEGKPTLEVEYRLKDGERYLTVTSRYTNPHDDAITFELRDAVRADKGFEHQLTGRLYVCHDFWWRQAYGVLALGHELTPVADTLDRGRPVFAYQGETGSAITLEPNAEYEIKRLLIPGENDMDVHAVAKQHSGQELARLAVLVRDPQGVLPEARMKVTQGDTIIGRAITPQAGPLFLHLPPGEYTLEATTVGGGSNTAKMTLSQEQQLVEVTLPEAGYVSGIVTDDAGNAIPAKIQYRGNDVEDPDFGPDTKSFLVKNLQYTPDGLFEIALSPGVYDVIISRGPEYDADFQTINVQRGQSTKLESKLARSVDTTGWVSSDFHSHSSPSGDNTSDQRGRVLNLLAEHIEFAPCTEHNRISTYLPHLQILKAEQFMATCSGMELTGNPLPINHQNAFPLKHYPHAQDGGGPTTDENPIVQIERLAMWDGGSDKLVQENHPNLEQIWADQDLDGQEDEGFEKMFGFMDVIEIHPPADIFSAPGAKTGQYRNVIQPWLRMLNKGYRIPGVVNTDAHYNFHGSGWLRNYIKSGSDDPTEIDTMEMVHESEHGHVVMTNGPYLEVTANGGDANVLPGDDVEASSGQLQLQIKVQCPNWFDVNRVQIFVNGRPSPDLNFTRRTTPQRFGDGVVKFDQRIDVTLETDAHIIVATIGEGLKLGPVMGPEHGEDVPVALTNPVFVDVDGDGFQPNGDLLGLPFPYKAD